MVAEAVVEEVGSTAAVGAGSIDVEVEAGSIDANFEA